MKEWRWVSLELVLAVHGRQLAEHGGADGIRDRAALESAMARPINLANYNNPDAIELAAAYAFALAKNHSFVDGNKRVAWIATRIFLLDNGVKLRFDKIEAIQAVQSLASSEMSESDFERWLRERVV